MGHRLPGTVLALALAGCLPACLPAASRPAPEPAPAAAPVPSPSAAPAAPAVGAEPPRVQPPPARGVCADLSRGSTASLEAALAAGADVNGPDPDDPSNRPPLLCAAEAGQADAVRLLLRKRANPEATAPGGDGAGRTALLAAAEEGHAAVARFLLTGGARPNARDVHGWTPLLWAAFGKDRGNAAGYAETVTTLLDNGGDPNAAGRGGETALLLAIDRGYPEAVRRIAFRGAALDRRDARGETPLMAAAGAGEKEMVEALLAAGAAVDPRDRNGKTAWVRAAERGSRPVMELLNRAGARERYSQVDAGTAFRNALCEGDVELARQVAGKGRGAPSGGGMAGSALPHAARCGKAESVRFLLDGGADPSSRDGEGKTAWVRAAERGDRAVLSLLEGRGAVAEYGSMSWEGSGASPGEPPERAVTDGAAWADLWRRAFGKEAPPVDFARYFVACVFPGAGTEGRIEIAFREPVAAGGELVAEYAASPARLEGSPGPYRKLRIPGQYAMKVFPRRDGLTPAVRRAAAGAGTPAP